jgi:hypothetical protein
MLKDANIFSIAAVNHAAGENRILADDLGPNAISRIDRDVLALSCIKYAMIFENVNNISLPFASRARRYLRAAPGVPADYRRTIPTRDSVVPPTHPLTPHTDYFPVLDTHARPLLSPSQA